MIIELIDFKGDRVELTFTGVYKVSRKGLTEVWVYAVKDWLPKCWKIPVPVFTDWWFTGTTRT